MTLQLAPISSAVLSLAWPGQTGITYTLQTSHDLAEWNTLPYVVEGSNVTESYFLEQATRSTFVRLCYDSDGDTDDNSLPDMWEWQNFGRIGVLADDDPDMDGLSNASEWLRQSDPNDFYNGEWPVIHLSCGSDWLVPSGKVSSQYLSLSLTTPAGDPWSHAPVYLTVAGGTTQLVTTEDAGSSFSTSLVIWTDATGRLPAGSPTIHVLASSTGGSVDDLLIRAGNSYAGLRIHSIGDAFGPPPRELNRWTDSAGQPVYSWKGDPGSAESILIEERDAQGNWTTVVEVASQNLPSPDQETGAYSLVVGN